MTREDGKRGKWNNNQKEDGSNYKVGWGQRQGTIGRGGTEGGQGHNNQKGRQGQLTMMRTMTTQRGIERGTRKKQLQGRMRQGQGTMSRAERYLRGNCAQWYNMKLVIDQMIKHWWTNKQTNKQTMKEQMNLNKCEQ